MVRITALLTMVSVCCLVCVQTVSAQTSPPDPVSFNFDGGIALQSSTDLKDVDGDFSVNRWFISAGITCLLYTSPSPRDS